MPRERPPEFRWRAIELARMREEPMAQIASKLVIVESCLRRSMDIADAEEGHKPSLNSDERAELARLRREKRLFETEIEILKGASAYFMELHPAGLCFHL